MQPLSSSAFWVDRINQDPSETENGFLFFQAFKIMVKS